ncbi:ankyrin repeat-containing domain protein [Aspergillus varians]
MPESLWHKAQKAMFETTIHGHTEICRILLDKGLWDRVLLPSSKLLRGAACNGKEEIIHTILRELPGSADDGGWVRSARLQNAACHGQVDIIKDLLNDQELQLNLADKDYHMPLHHAVDGGHLDAVCLLLDSGRDVGLNFKCLQRVQGYRALWLTPLMLCALHGHTEMVRRLLKCEDIDIVMGFTGWTALSIATKRGHHEIVHAINEWIALHGDGAPSADAQIPDETQITDGAIDGELSVDQIIALPADRSAFSLDLSMLENPDVLEDFDFSFYTR